MNVVASVIGLLLFVSAAWGQSCVRDCAEDDPRDLDGCCVDADDGCSEGKIRNEDTDGECCWPGQAYAIGPDRCVGLAACPDGWRRDATGEGCVRCADDDCPDAPLAPEAPSVVPEPASRLDYVPVQTIDFGWVPAGHYTRGSPPDEVGRFRNERAHDVQLTQPLWVARTELTRGAWRQLVGRAPAVSSKCDARCPITAINWYEALTYLNRLSEKEALTPCYHLSGCEGAIGAGCADGFQSCAGAYTCKVVRFRGTRCVGYRLPTEAEWEHLARAGLSAAGVGLDAAWQAGNCDRLQPVATRGANGFGLHDTLGNAMEWTWDGYGRYPKGAQVDPVHPLGLTRVVRGGTWASAGSGLRFALRARLPAGGRNVAVGFRVVRTARPEEAPKPVRVVVEPPAVRSPRLPPPIQPDTNRVSH